MLDKRLQMCADMVSGSGIICDVGTDHAYLAAELILSGKCRKVIASDVKKGPLEAARNTIEKYGVADKVELILSDGLENIPMDGVTDVVIAGMGSETIIDILEKCDRLHDDINLILQPMTKSEILRKWLYENGFEIYSERLVDDGNRIYVVISAKWTAVLKKLTESEAIRGFFNDNEELAVNYRETESRRLKKISDSLEKAGKHYEAVHYNALSCKISGDPGYVSLNTIYEYLDSLYPFKTQEKWDNSGILIDNLYMECSKILLTLDIDYRACFEAYCCGAELIISHHPIIFEPLKRISSGSPAAYLLKNDISAICMHTNLDKSPNGTNGMILRKIREYFELDGEPEIFEDCGDGLGFGYVCELTDEVEAEKFGRILKELFGCEVVRTNSRGKKSVKRFAFCSGSGGSMLGEAIDRDCDSYITGDVKHDVWIEANNRGISLFDCCHFHTENLVLEELRCVLEERFPQLEVIIAESSADPVKYIK